MTRKQKKLLWRIIASALAFVCALLVPEHKIITPLIWLIPYLIVGYSVLIKAVKNILHGQVFDENFLMAVATVGAYAIGEYHEAVFVMLFYQLGELFQGIAVGKSRRSISSLMELRPDTANVLRDGEEITVSPEEIEVGEIFVVRSGERIALDGVVVEGSCDLDTLSVTGEAVPKHIEVGDRVISGCVAIGGVIKASAEKSYGESTAAKIMKLVEQSSMSKARAENFITAFARYYTPAVVISALILALAPPIFSGNLTAECFTLWIYRALNFLVISCPCALVISVPLTFFAGIGRASREGILVKGSNYLEKLASCKIAVFDKTGTLTKGKFEITDIFSDKMSKDELLSLAALVESYSTHPIASAIYEGCHAERSDIEVKDVREISGKGVCAEVKGDQIAVGNAALMDECGVEINVASCAGTVVYLAKNGEYMGYIVLSDTVKPNAKQTLCELKRMGIKKTVMLTGDGEEAASLVAEKLPLDIAYSGLLPHDKVEITEQIMLSEPDLPLMFVGDGMNDAPVLARADIGISMGELGSDAAIEASDIVIMNDDISLLPKAIGIAAATGRIVRQNIVFSLAVKGAVLILSTLGICGMWEAVFADVGVMVIAVLNSLRMMRK